MGKRFLVKFDGINAIIEALKELKKNTQ